jgi:predicted enzyme related to lactoylglutathione lyase
MAEPMFRKIDNLMLRIGDLDAAIVFYGQALGHRLVWRTDEAAGFALPDSEAELVVHTKVGPETDLLVENVERAVAFFETAGGKVLAPPFDIAIGKCAVVQDPFGNVLVMLDQTKGKLATDGQGRVTGIEPR